MKNSTHAKPSSVKSFLAQVGTTTLVVFFLISALLRSPWRGFLLDSAQPTPVPTPITCPGSKGEGVIKLAVDLPLSGKDIHDGKPALHGVELALNQTCELALTRQGKVSKYVLELVPKDDVIQTTGYNPDQGKQNIENLTKDAQVAGVIGPFNSDVAVEEIPVAASQGPVALISPSNTADCLTEPSCEDGKSSQVLLTDARKTYFRTAALDSKVADRLANYLFATEHYTTASIFEQGSNIYSEKFGDSFYTTWLTLGGKVVSDNQSPIRLSQSDDYRTGLQQLTSKPPDVILFAGDASGAMLLHGLMKQDNRLAKIPFASGGALMNEGSTTDLGSFLGGPIYAIAPVGDPSQSGTNGQIFLGDYDATYDDSPTPYSASAYDCTNILIQAIQKALDDGIEAPTNTDDQQNAQKFRQKVIDELHSSSFSSQGVTGVYSFERNGDTTNPTVSIYQLSNDHWYLKKMETYLSKDTSWHLKYISQ